MTLTIVGSGVVSGGVTLGDGDSLDVASGGTAVGATVTSDGTVSIAAAGFSIVSYDGEIDVNAGGVIIAATLDNIGFAGISGTASGTIINSGGEQDIGSGGVASATTAYAGGLEAVSASGLSLSAVLSGGEQDVDGLDAVASATLVRSGGLLAVRDGGLSVNAIVQSGGTELVDTPTGAATYLSAGVALITIVESGGTQVETYVKTGETFTSVQSGGEVYTSDSYGGTVITDSAAGDIVDPGTADGTVVNSGGVIVLDGGIVHSLDVAAGGTEQIGGAVTVDGFTEIPTSVFTSHVVVSQGVSGIVDAGGIAVSGYIASGGTLFVASGGAANATYVAGGGTMLISSGGLGFDTALESGGTEIISNGGIETLASGTNATLSSGGTQIGRVLVSSGGAFFADNAAVASGLYVLSSGVATINSGGTVVSGHVVSGGELAVFSGGLAADTYVFSGASVFVAASGLARNTRVESGGFEYIESGGFEVLTSANGVAAAGTYEVGTIVIESGGQFDVSSGGMAQGVTADHGGALFLFGSGGATGAVVFGDLQVSSGGLSVSAQIASGGQAFLFAGGTAYDTQVDKSATEVISANGVEVLNTANYFTGLGNVGSVIIASGGVMNVGSGGIGGGIDVHGGGELLLGSGGIVNSSFVENGGSVGVDAGGTAYDTKLNSGGTEQVFAGGVAFSTSAGAGGFVVVAGFTSATIISGSAYEDVLAGGTARGATAIAKGLEQVESGGTAQAALIEGGGVLFVSAGGRASATVIGSGGTAFLDGGADGYNWQVESGGTADVSAGAAIASPVVNAGGLMFLAGTANGAIVVDGTLIATGAGADLAGSIAGTGTIVVPAGALVHVTSGGAIADVVISGGAMVINGVTLVTDPLTIEAGGSLTGTGLIGGAIRDDGTISVSGGQLELTGAISGPGALVIGDGGTLRLDSPLAAGTTVDFAGGAAGTLALGPGVPLPATVLGQTASDKIINVACFAAGTRIATPTGEIPVEALRPGDRVLTARGAAPVVWTGWRSLRPSRHPRPWDVRPVRVRANAFGPGHPLRDLVLSPDHAVLVDGHLIPIRYLLNGRTIVQQNVAEITYVHIELPAHGILLAEGLPCESYLDTGNRSEFANAGPLISLHADFSPGAIGAGRYAPLVLAGPAVAVAKTRLLAQAEALGHALTENPALHVVVDGQKLPVAIDRRTWRVALPAGGGRVRLLSRSWVPAHTRPHEQDTRTLGVAIGHLRADGQPLRLDDSRLTSGWHAVEAWKAQTGRWTDGDAGLALAGVQVLEFNVVMSGSYWAASRPRRPINRFPKALPVVGVRG